MIEGHEEVKIVLSKYDKKQLRGNIIKFIIGIILLCLSGIYIQGHPAEKVSVFSGFEVLRQKIDVSWHNIFGGNGDLVDRKYSLEKYYKELIIMAEGNSCLSTGDYKDLEQTYNNLKKEPNKYLNIVIPGYIENAYKFEALVKADNC